MHRTAFVRDGKPAFGRHYTTAGLDKQERLSRDRVIQLFGVLGIVTPDAHDFADRKVNPGTVDVLVLIAHGSTPLGVS